ncbi:MAG: VanZ family protein [Cyclobacteriaceae bacterium]
MDKRVIKPLILIACIGWALLILILTLTPGEYVPSYSLFSYDKLGHAGIFCIQAVLLIYTFWYVNGRETSFSIAVGMIIAIIYGFVIEGIQGIIPGRSMDMYDAIANITGSFLAPVVFYLMNKVFRIKKI